MSRFVCIHGHFYQPPRENPWLESLEQQTEAHPYHDWNVRIAAECYAPNAAARILDNQDRIIQIVNNYSRISFNFGPTLLSWLENKEPEIYSAILEADQESRERFSGHGSALAQAYHHSILPLATQRDKVTEVRWGVADFRSRFGRDPEGMWLPETAVDTETLEVLATEGICFAILSPQQARRVRVLGKNSWHDVSGGKIDTRQVYKIYLPSGRSMALFFYNDTIARAVAFEGLLNRGEFLVDRLLGGFRADGSAAQLSHIATDGETYGHHHRHGEMALAYALKAIEESSHTQLTNYGEFLEKTSPKREVEIVEDSSWSCSHGIARWRSDCGCFTGGRREWNQYWREPLRDSLNWLRDELVPLFEKEGGRLLHDPWEARNQYIRLVQNRSRSMIRDFLQEHGKAEAKGAEGIRILKLMEMQRCALMMFTSCGWFFNDVSGIESVQILLYAGKALQLAQELFEVELEGPFLKRLATSRSNLLEKGDASQIFRKALSSARVSLDDVAAHFAIGSLFQQYPARETLFCYSLDAKNVTRSRSEKGRLALGRLRVHSEITRESRKFVFCALLPENRQLTCRISAASQVKNKGQLFSSLLHLFEKGDEAKTLGEINRHFPAHNYSLRSLLGDQRRIFAEHIFETSINEVEEQFSRIYRRQAPLIQQLADESTPLPVSFRLAAEFVLNTTLRRQLREEQPNLDRIRRLLQEAAENGVELDIETLSYDFNRALERLSFTFWQEPSNLDALKKLSEAIELTRSISLQVSLWALQNLFYEVARSLEPLAEKQGPEAEQWKELFENLGERLGVKIE